MLKVKNIKLSGFRGILKPQELDFAVKGKKEPRSLVLFGPNSSGKTSFVDGLEWFLSPDSKIEWLQREEAREKAYPHQAIGAGESSVAIEFYDTDKSVATLTKRYDQSAKTKPVVSDENGFKNIYSAFVIRPYLRYMEIIEFVYNSTGHEKYQKLASWMGFENELLFQEKISVTILRELNDYEKQLTNTVQTFETQVKSLMGSQVAIEAAVLAFCNSVFVQHKLPKCTDIKPAWLRIAEMDKLKTVSAVSTVIEKLTRLETSLGLVVINESLPEEVRGLQKQVAAFLKEKESAKRLNTIDLYTRALDILAGNEEKNVPCPLCGIGWERDQLLVHISDEFKLLEQIKNQKDEIERAASGLKAKVVREASAIRGLQSLCSEAETMVPGLLYEKIKTYLASLTALESSLSGILNRGIEIILSADDLRHALEEKRVIAEKIQSEIKKTQPSAAEVKLIEDTEKLSRLRDKWNDLRGAQLKQEFVSAELNKFGGLKDDVAKAVQKNVKSRFDEISERIGKYFALLRNDKDISNIQIVLNEEKGRAAGRSAEIQLDYYSVSVKPAYKVLSESLLNSLGLAVYFACVKQFNDRCKFIALDDIMNSLDTAKRDTLLDLIEQEFSDYQIILFTHDYYWFQKITRRFPDWAAKKIKSWDYSGGAKIDGALTTREEIEEYLTDSTKVETAGWALGRHVETVLNELCESVWAELRYRYAKSDPPSMEELFNALHKRIKDKAKGNSVVDKIAEAKKYEPILRNFVSHARTNQPATISGAEIRRAAQEWFSLEDNFWCSACKRFVEYKSAKDVIECKCGKLCLTATSKS